MKYLFAGALAAFAALTVPQPVQAAVFAAHLEMVNNGNGTFNLNYRLNEAANQGVTVNIKGPSPAQTVVRTFTFPNQSAGPQTVVWDGKNSSDVQVPVGAYSWEVIASTNNAGGAPYVKTIDGTLPVHTFYQPNGIDVDDVTTSPHFGKIYVSNLGGTVAVTQRPTTDGIYILSNDLQDITGQGDTAYAGNVAWNDLGASPWRTFVAPDGDVFITDWSDGNSGVWIMNPDNPTEPFSEIFDNTSRDPATGLTVNHGSISSVYVEGVGANRVMYALDEDFTGGGAAETLGSVWAHAIGDTTSGYTGTPTLLYDDSANGNALINYIGEVIKDPNPNRTGWFISQNRYTENSANPSVFHFNGTAIDWKSSVDFPEELGYLNSNASIDINSDGTLLVAAGYQYFKVVNITDLANESIVFVDGGSNSSHREVSFDPAGNILIGSAVNEHILYYSKQGSNTFTTPNSATSQIFIGPASAQGWELY